MVRYHFLEWVRFGTSPPDQHLYSDAFRSGWGSHLDRFAVREGEVVARQPSRDEGDVSGIAVISGGGHRSSGDHDVQQLDSCGLRQQAGRHGVPLPLLVGQSPSEVDGES